MQTTTKSTLDCFLIHNFEHAQDLVYILRLRVLSWVVANLASALEMLRQIGIIKCLIILLFLHFARDSLVSCVLSNIVLFPQELCKIHWVTIRLELLQNLLKLWLVLVLSQISMDAHLFFHLVVVGCHEITHLVHHVVLTLGLNGLLVVSQLSREQVSLLILELLSLLLSLFVVFEAHDLVHVPTASVVNLVCVHKPDVVAVVTNELCLHLKDLYLAHLLQVVADLEALDVGVSLKLSHLKQLVLICYSELLVVDFLGGCLVARGVDRRLELNRDRVRLRVLVGKYTTLHVVDKLRVLLRSVSQFVHYFSELAFGDGLC